MKYTFILLVVSIGFLLSSCSDDDTVNTPVTPPGTVLFSKDSLVAAKIPGITGLESITQIFEQTISASEVSIEFRLQSNIDSSLGCTGSYRDSINGTVPPAPLNYNIYAPIDSAFSYTCGVSTQPFYARFTVNLLVSQIQSVYRYVRMVNIKVTKVN